MKIDIAPFYASVWQTESLVRHVPLAAIEQATVVPHRVGAENLAPPSWQRGIRCGSGSGPETLATGSIG